MERGLCTSALAGVVRAWSAHFCWPLMHLLESLLFILLAWLMSEAPSVTSITLLQPATKCPSWEARGEWEGSCCLIES